MSMVRFTVHVLCNKCICKCLLESISYNLRSCMLVLTAEAAESFESKALKI